MDNKSLKGKQIRSKKIMKQLILITVFLFGSGCVINDWIEPVVAVKDPFHKIYTKAEYIIG